MKINLNDKNKEVKKRTHVNHIAKCPFQLSVREFKNNGDKEINAVTFKLDSQFHNDSCSSFAYLVPLSQKEKEQLLKVI